MPKFFMSRIIIWGMLAALVSVLALILAISTGQYQLLVPGFFLAIGCAFYGYQIYQIARQGEYFVMRLTCTDIRPLGVLQGAVAYFDPTSQTAFKRAKSVIFTTENGQTISFTYERYRRFVIGQKYDFYFKKPRDGQDLTSETLERLRIDHTIVSSTIEVS